MADFGIGVENDAVSIARKEKKPSHGEGFEMVGTRGFEPRTSTVSM